MRKRIFGYNTGYMKEHNLCLDDIAILEWFVEFMTSKKIKSIILEGNVWYWISYEKLIADLDFIIHSTATASRRMNNLVACNLLLKKLIPTKVECKHTFHLIKKNTISSWKNPRKRVIATEQKK